MNSPPSPGTAPLPVRLLQELFTLTAQTLLSHVSLNTQSGFGPHLPTTLATHQATDHPDHFYLSTACGQFQSSSDLSALFSWFTEMLSFPASLGTFILPHGQEKAPTWLYPLLGLLIYQTSQPWQASELSPRSSILCLHSLLQVILPY